MYTVNQETLNKWILQVTKTDQVNLSAPCQLVDTKSCRHRQCYGCLVATDTEGYLRTAILRESDQWTDTSREVGKYPNLGLRNTILVQSTNPRNNTRIVCSHQSGETPTVGLEITN